MSTKKRYEISLNNDIFKINLIDKAFSLYVSLPERTPICFNNYKFCYLGSAANIPLFKS